MRRIVCTFAAYGLIIAAVGCGKNPTSIPTPTVITANTSTVPPEPPPIHFLPPISTDPTADTKYDVAMGEAIGLMTEGRMAEALVSLQRAQAAKDGEVVRGEIERLKQRLEWRTSAEKTAADIKIVLREGRADEAAKLTGQALAQFGGGDLAETFTSLKRQADAMLTGADAARRLRQDADAAVAAKNLRAALVNYEQAFALQPDDAVRTQLEQVRATVTQYDDLRTKAVQLRRDPNQLDEALDTFRQAAGVWDTLQVRQDIETCTVALQNRRDRIAIADFEVRGRCVEPMIGRQLAEDLVGPFRRRFDVVERQQLGKLIDELRLDADDLNGSDGPRRELGRLGKIRYLVVGSIAPLGGGLVVNARVVEVSSGLVVQTAKIVGINLVQINASITQLAGLLQMSDAERLNYEQQVANQPPRIVVNPISIPATLPPPPPISNIPPTAIVTYSAQLSNPGGVTYDDFQRLPPPAPSVSVSLVFDKNHQAAPRLTQLAISLGDNLFARGQYRDADAQFRLALSLDPGHQVLQERVDRCRGHLNSLPPPPPPRPRLAVLDFTGYGVSPGTGACVAEQLAPYFNVGYDVVDRGTVYWYMGRLGLSLRDVIVDPQARAYLGRALDVRYFIVGTLRPQPAGLEVAAHELDACTGQRLDSATVVARNSGELKFRVPEIAQWMLMSPGERAARMGGGVEYQRLCAQAEGFVAQAQFGQAVVIFHTALKARPDDVRIQSLLANAERQAHFADLEAQRRRESEQSKILAVAYRQRQDQLARDAEQARRDAERAAAAINAADKERQRRAAFDRLIAQGRAARQAQQWQQAQGLYESALAFDRTPEIVREHDQVKSRVAELATLKLAQETAARERKLRQDRDLETARLRDQLDNERKKRDAEDRIRRKQQEDRDLNEYVRLLDNAKKLQDNRKHDEAVGLLQQANRLKPGSEVDQLIGAAMVLKAQAAGDQQKAAQAKARMEAEAKLKKEQDEKAATIALVQIREREANARRQEEEAKRRAMTPPPLPKTPLPLPTPPPMPKTEPKATTPPPLPKTEPKATTPPPLPKTEPKAVPKSTTPPPLPKTEPKATTPPPLPKTEPKATTPPPLPKTEPKAVPKSTTPPPLPKTEPKATTPPPLPKTEPKATTPPPLPKTEPKATTPPPLPKTEPKAVPKSTTPPPLPKTEPKATTPPPLPKTEPKAVPKAATPPPLPKTEPKAAPKATTPTPQPKTPPPAYSQKMTAGANAEKVAKYGEALSHYQDALQAFPGDAVATTRVEYAKQMDLGTKAINEKKFADAVKPFEAALKAVPNDPAAKKALDRVRSGK